MRPPNFVSYGNYIVIIPLSPTICNKNLKFHTLVPCESFWYTVILYLAGSEVRAIKLEWMGAHRDEVEALIHYCNIYAAAYKLEQMEFQGVRYSFAQIQVLEYLLENEERNENMSAIAARLGITRSNFTKIVNRLVSKGLLEKEPMPGSRKELRVRVNELGRKLYEDYSQDILRWHFSPMFQSLDQIPPEYRSYICSALYNAMHGSNCAGSAGEH